MLYKNQFYYCIYLNKNYLIYNNLLIFFLSLSKFSHFIILQFDSITRKKLLKYFEIFSYVFLLMKLIKIFFFFFHVFLVILYDVL